MRGGRKRECEAQGRWGKVSKNVGMREGDSEVGGKWTKRRLLSSAATQKIIFTPAFLIKLALNKHLPTPAGLSHHKIYLSPKRKS